MLYTITQVKLFKENIQISLRRLIGKCNGRKTLSISLSQSRFLEAMGESAIIIDCQF